MVELFKSTANSNFMELTICRVFSDPVTCGLTTFFYQSFCIGCRKLDVHASEVLLFLDDYGL